MNAGKEFNYYTYKSDSSSATLPKSPDEPADYLSQKMNTFTDFDMASQYANEPPEKIRILQEIYDTEKTYVKALTLVDEIFINELALCCPKTRKHCRAMFGEISAICKTHQILLESMRTKPIGEVFIKFIPFLKLYAGYASHYQNALKIYAKLMSRNDFRKALTRIEEDPRLEGKKIQAYLIMPIQRIPRYIMLIQNLMGYSTESGDMTNLYQALNGMQTLTDQIQSCMAAYENGERLLTIQLNFGLDGHILEPGRVLLKEGMLYKRELNGSANYQETIVFLFNDIILYGHKKLNLMPYCKYEPSAILSLRHCIVQLDDIGGSISIRCGSVSIDFTADVLNGVTEWYNEICDAIDNAKKLRDTLRKESFKQKTLVFDRGFWQKNRDRFRNIMSSEKPSLVSRVLSRKKPLPKLGVEDFLRGQWTTSSNPPKHRYNVLSVEAEKELLRQADLLEERCRKRRMETLRQEYHSAIAKQRYYEVFQGNNATLSQPETGIHPILAMGTQGDNSTLDTDESDFVWTDEEEYVPPEKKIPIRRRRSSYDEEDRRPRTFGKARVRACASEPRRQLAVDDIRKLSYQNRTLEPFHMVSDDDDEEEIDAIELKVKGERPRRWWEDESAPPVIKNQKTSIMDSVRNNCSIM